MRVKIGFLFAMIAAALAHAGYVSAEEPQLTQQECARKAQAAADKLRGIGRVMEADAEYAEAHGGALSPDLAQEFVQWYQVESNRAGSDLPGLGRTDLSPAEAGRRQAAVDRFIQERNDRQRARMGAIQREAASGCSRWLPRAP